MNYTEQKQEPQRAKRQRMATERASRDILDAAQSLVFLPMAGTT